LRVRSFSVSGVRVLAVDRGRILIRLQHSVAILRTNGAIEATIPVGQVPALLAGDNVIAQHGSTLAQHLLPGAAVVRQIEIPAGTTLVDAEGPLAVLVGRDRTVTVAHLTNGRRATFRPPGVGRVLAQIEPSGLIVAANVKGNTYHGRIELFPWSSVTDRLR
jgi:hypothetical protein